MLRARRDVIVVVHRLGFVMANAGIDFSNVDATERDTRVLLLPADPDGECERLRRDLHERAGASVAVIINDSHGRAWRNGTVGVAIGASGIAALLDLRGKPDLFGRALRITQVGLADELAAAASLLMGQADEGTPIVWPGVSRTRKVKSGSRGCGRKSWTSSAEDADGCQGKLPGERATAGPARQRVTGRRSIRRYLELPVARELVDSLLDAATAAASAHNRQPWRFLVIEGLPAKQRLADAMAGRLRSDRCRDGDPPEVIEADVSRSYARLTGAPVLVVVCMTMADMDRYPDDRRNQAERLMAVQGTAMAAQNLLLAAHAAGLGACWMCAPLFCADTVASVLTLPPDWEPLLPLP